MMNRTTGHYFEGSTRRNPILRVGRDGNRRAVTEVQNHGEHIARLREVGNHAYIVACLYTKVVRPLRLFDCFWFATFGYNDVSALRTYAATLGRRFHERMKFVVCRGTQHDHAVSINKLGMGDAPVFVRHDELRFESECFAQPIDSGLSIALAQCRNDCCLGICVSVHLWYPRSLVNCSASLMCAASLSMRDVFR